MVGLAIAEGIARLAWGPDLVAVVEAGFEEADASTAMAVRTGDGRVFGARPGHRAGPVAIDAHGIRGPDGRTLAPKPPGVRRVALLGDSVAFGQAVPYADTMGGVLEAELGDGAEVWNLAFPGYNTVQEAAALDVFGPRLEPDVVLVVWVTNDAASLELPRGGDGGRALYTERRVYLLPGLPEDLQVGLWRRSRLFRYVGKASPVWTGPVLLEPTEHAAAIAAIASTSRDLGASRIVFAMAPKLVDYPGWEAPPGPGRPSAPHHRDPTWRFARQAAEGAGFEIVDLTQALASEPPSSVAADELHPNAAGHRRIGAYLGSVLR